MKPLAWMLAAGFGSWLALTAMAGSGVNPEALFGMLGPLIAAAATWIAIERTRAKSPERLTNVLITAFAAKALFFGAYVVVMLRALALRPMPFVASFVGYFVGLYVLQALFLKRLTMDSGDVSTTTRGTGE